MEKKKIKKFTAWQNDLPPKGESSYKCKLLYVSICMYIRDSGPADTYAYKFLEIWH